MTKINWLDRTLLLGPYMCLCLSQKELDAACKHFKVDSEKVRLDGTCLTLESNNKQACIITIKNFKGKYLDEIVGLIVHESSHALDFVISVMKEKHAGEEIRAYILQNISQTLVHEFIQRVEFDSKFKIIKLKAPKLKKETK